MSDRKKEVASRRKVAKSPIFNKLGMKGWMNLKAVKIPSNHFDTSVLGMKFFKQWPWFDFQDFKLCDTVLLKSRIWWMSISSKALRVLSHYRISSWRILPLELANHLQAVRFDLKGGGNRKKDFLINTHPYIHLKTCNQTLQHKV